MRYIEQKRPALVGEKIKVVAPQGRITYAAGDIFVVAVTDDVGVSTAGVRHRIWHLEYVVLGDVIPDGVIVHTADNITREYKPVKREAQFGELVRVDDATKHYSSAYTNGEIITITTTADSDTWVADDRRGAHRLFPDQYVVLAPTSIVHVAGKRYRAASQGAQVCQRILVVQDIVYHRLDVGSVHTVQSIRDGGLGSVYVISAEFGRRALPQSNYLVLLDPTPSEPAATASVGAKPGDYIKIVNSECMRGEYDNGSILQVIEIKRDYVQVRGVDEIVLWGEFVVVSPLEAAQARYTAAHSALVSISQNPNAEWSSLVEATASLLEARAAVQVASA